MSSRETWLNVLTGISQGSFDKIYLRDANGNVVDLLTLLGSLGSVTDVISKSSELVVTTNGTTKILTLNLRRICDQHCISKCVGSLHRHDCPNDHHILYTHTPITLQLDGTTQSGATT